MRRSKRIITRKIKNRVKLHVINKKGGAQNNIDYANLQGSFNIEEPVDDVSSYKSKYENLQEIFDSQVQLIKIMHTDDKESSVGDNIWVIYKSLIYEDPITKIKWAPKLDLETKKLLQSLGHIE